MSPPIAIIGAGQAGLTLARLLYIKNIDFIVFEENAITDPGGFWATLDINPEAAQVVLKEAKLFEQFSALASFDTQVIALADHHGEIITLSETMDLPRIDWEDFRTMFLDSIPAEKIRNGSSEHGFKLVVGADGRQSIVRPMITPANPRYYGITYLRTSVSKESPFWTTAVGKLNHTGYMAVGHGKQILAIKDKAGIYTLLIGLPLAEDWHEPSICDQDAFREHVIEHELNRWSPRVLNLLRYSDGEFRKVQLYVMPAQSMSWKSVSGFALIGDAAHSCPPWSRAAPTSSMEDAFELAQQISVYGLDDLNEAVAAYEQLMFPRAIELIEKATATGDIFFAKDSADLIPSFIG